MMAPRKTKYATQFKGRMRGNAKNGTTVEFGMYGMKAVGSARITAAQIETVRRVLIRSVRKVGRLWIRIFPDVPVTKKPAEVRQGRGKGSVDRWVCKVKPGRVLFEIDGLTLDEARSVFSIASDKLPIKIRLVSKVSEELRNELVQR